MVEGGEPRLPDAEALFEDAPCGLLLTGADGTIRRVNRTFCRLTGLAADELVDKREVALADANKRGDQFNAKLLLNMWHLPVASYHLTARFGDYGLWSSYHTGLDFAAPSGTPIYAVANGTISSASYDGSYGNKTVETLEDGTELWYCHQTSFVVSVGETVHAGELIGYIGSTGHVTGPHLHLEVRPGGGDPVDPYSALVVHGVTP
jgi:murein DD-endopeptidase MepM/ murein hydrolase activator NlpD